jgi:hypothetical protein
MRDYVGYVDLKCPKCGHVNENIGVDVEEANKLNIFWCGLEDGGCDTPFVYCPEVEIKPTIYTISEDPVKYPA